MQIMAPGTTARVEDNVAVLPSYAGELLLCYVRTTDFNDRPLCLRLHNWPGITRSNLGAQPFFLRLSYHPCHSSPF